VSILKKEQTDALNRLRVEAMLRRLRRYKPETKRHWRGKKRRRVK
jgi:hypothetical protein